MGCAHETFVIETMSRWRTYADLDKLTGDAEDWLQGLPISLFTSIIGLGGQNPKIPSLEILAKRKLCEMHGLRHHEQKDYILAIPVSEMLKSLDAQGVPNAFYYAHRVEEKCLNALSRENPGYPYIYPESVYTDDVYASLRRLFSETVVIQLAKMQALGSAFHCRFELSKKILEKAALNPKDYWVHRLSNSHNPQYEAVLAFVRIDRSSLEQCIELVDSSTYITVRVISSDEQLLVEIPLENIELCSNRTNRANFLSADVGRFSPFVEKLWQQPPVAKVRSIFITHDGEVVPFVIYIIKLHLEYASDFIYFYHPFLSNLHWVVHQLAHTSHHYPSSFSSVNRTEYVKDSQVHVIYELHAEKSKGRTISFLPESQLLSYYKYACPTKPTSPNLIAWTHETESQLNLYPDYQLYF
jgi:hypothetical protein